MDVPGDGDVDEAEHIAQEHRQEGPERRKALPMRGPQFQHHNGDDDGDDAVAESLEPRLVHDFGRLPLCRVLKPLARLGLRNATSGPPCSLCSAATLSVTSAGTAITIPAMPHSQPPNQSARNTMMGFSSSRCPTSSGWTTCPSSVASPR